MGWGIDVGLATLAGGALSAVGGLYSAKQSAKASQEINEKQIEWEREKATHAHQWEMQDLRAAGLNPLLAANSGAKTGSITAVQPDTSGYAKAGNAIASAIQLQNENKRVENETKATSAQAELNQAQAMQTYAQNKWIDPKEKAHLEQTFKTISNIKANTAETAARIDNIKKDIELKEAQKWRTYHQNQLDDAEKDYKRKQGKYYEVEAISKAIGGLPGISAYKAVSKYKGKR